MKALKLLILQILVINFVLGITIPVLYYFNINSYIIGGITLFFIYLIIARITYEINKEQKVYKTTFIDRRD